MLRLSISLLIAASIITADSTFSRFCERGGIRYHISDDCKEFQKEWIEQKVFYGVQQASDGTLFDPKLCALNTKQIVDCGGSSGRFQYLINSLWDGKPIDHAPIKVTLSPGEDNSVVLNIEAPLFNDPAAPTTPPGPTDMLWNYEVVEAFFLNSKDSTYLEVEFGPYGHYLVLLLQGRRNAIKKLLPLKYTAVISEDSTTWKGEAVIPADYFPSGVDRFNAFAIHGSDPDITYEALHPQIPPITQPDLLSDYGPIDISDLLEQYGEDYSDVWKMHMKPMEGDSN